MEQNRTESNRRGHIAAIIMALIIGVLGTLWSLNNQKLNATEAVIPSPGIGTGLTVHFIDVSQGDSILLTCGKQSMLVDGGSERAGQTVVNYLRQQGVSKLDYLVSTHPHRDHCGGLAAVVQNYPVLKILSPVTESDNEYFIAFAKAAATAKDTITVPKAGDAFSLGDATVTVLGPIGDTSKTENINNISLVLRVDYGATSVLNDAISTLGQSDTVYEIANTMLGVVGGALAVIGVVVCPITSGDTAFRSARLILAEITHLDQQKIRNRLIITLPLLAVGAVLTQLDFNVLWRYFSWSNQTLAMISLWVATAYLVKEGKYRFGSLVTAVPGAFMSAVSLTYILMANEGFGLSASVAYPAGLCFAVALFAVYAALFRKKLAE